MPSDFTTSNNPKFLYFAELHRPFPEWVAAEPIPTASEFSKKASAAFADPERRLLPITTKQATFHSALDLFAHIDSYDAAVFERVKSACEFFGISDDVAPYAELFAEKVEKSAAATPAAEGKFAIRETLGGVDYKLLPMNNRDEISDSAFELAKMAAEQRIHFLTLQPAAVALVKAAQEHGVSDLPQLILRLGAERTHNVEKAAQLIQGRESLFVHADHQALRDAYQEAVRTEDPVLGMQKIAAIDDAAGLRYNYSNSSLVTLPSEIIFCGPLVSEVEKAAAENVMINDVFVPLVELQKIDRDRACFTLSKSAGESLIKNIDTTDAKDISVAVMSWEDADRRALLRLAAAI